MMEPHYITLFPRHHGHSGPVTDIRCILVIDETSSYWLGEEDGMPPRLYAKRDWVQA